MRNTDIRDMRRTTIAPDFALQTWDGEHYRTRTQSESQDEIEQKLLAHTLSMPKCPARIVKVQIVAEYHP